MTAALTTPGQLVLQTAVRAGEPFVVGPLESEEGRVRIIRMATVHRRHAARGGRLRPDAAARPVRFCASAGPMAPSPAGMDGLRGRAPRSGSSRRRACPPSGDLERSRWRPSMRRPGQPRTGGRRPGRRIVGVVHGTWRAHFAGLFAVTSGSDGSSTSTRPRKRNSCGRSFAWSWRPIGDDLRIPGSS